MFSRRIASNYYALDQAIQKLCLERARYEAGKSASFSSIYSAIEQHDLKKAHRLLDVVLIDYKDDMSIYEIVNDIAFQLKDNAILEKSVKNALLYNRLDAKCHHDFGKLLLISVNVRRILVDYIATLNTDCLRFTLSDRFDLEGVLKSIEQRIREVAAESPSCEIFLTYGNFLVFTHKLRRAAAAYRYATVIQKDCQIAYRNLAFVFALLGKQKRSHLAKAHYNFIGKRYAIAISDYAEAISLGSVSSQAYENLAVSYFHENRFSEAVAACADSPHKTIKLYTIWVKALKATNKVVQALKVAESACVTFPGNRYFRFPARLILPAIYETPRELSQHRTRFRRTLRAWVASFKDDKSIEKYALNDVKGTNFCLAYQGMCDRALQEEYGTLLSQLVQARYPQFVTSRQCKISRSHRTRTRIGYISQYLCWHTVGKLFLGWVENHDPDTFEVYVYHLGRSRDFLTQRFEDAASQFFHFGNRDVGEIGDIINGHNLDILVHLDYGMSVVGAKLAAARLAPIQCVAWGHPITSGLPTMDYFLSSNMMEPPNAQRHYSEKLVSLPNIGICVPRIKDPISKKTRADYSLSSDRNLYISPHSLFKHLPQYDKIFPLIALANPLAQFAFIERDTHSVEAARVFQTRLRDSFGQHNLDSDRYVRFVQSQSFDDYLRLLNLSDVYLDSFEWSGGMTSLEALGCMIPVVTLPGQFMRGRHSYAFLRRINVTETIAYDVDGYVRVATRLVIDQTWREEVLAKQAENIQSLYYDIECVSALEQFYKQLK